MKPLIVANWKMNPLRLKEALDIAREVEKGVQGIGGTEVVIAPPFPFLAPVGRVLKKVRLGARDAFGEDHGPFTGAVSGAQLASVGVTHVIVGHSETRAITGDDTARIKKKIYALLSQKITPIICIGEKEEAKEEGASVIGEMLGALLRDVKKNLLKSVVIAYEPIWAISTNPGAHPDTPEHAFQMLVYMRRVLTNLYDRKTAESVRIIYGGSINAAIAGGFFREGKMEGALVGKASLDPVEFLKIVRQAAGKS